MHPVIAEGDRHLVIHLSDHHTELPGSPSSPDDVHRVKVA